MTEPCIWLTRPEADSRQLAEMLAAHGIASIIAPVMTIAPRALDSVPEKPDAILLTSRHAAPALAALPDAWRKAIPVFTVGTATAQAARHSGFETVISGDQDVLSLLPTVRDHVSHGSRLLYLAGEETRIDVAGLLALHGIETQTLVTYEAHAQATLPPELVAALTDRHLSGAVFFSPRSAALAETLLGTQAQSQSVSNLDAYCLSLAIAAAAGSLPWRAIYACPVPTLAAMTDLVVSRAKKVI